MEVVIREKIDADHSFIVHSWIHSYKSSAFARHIKPNLFLHCHDKIVNYILSKPSVKTLVAVDEDLIYGYAVFEEQSPNPLAHGPIFHYTYVKLPFNGFGICRKLIEASPFKVDTHTVFTTHYTHAGKNISEKYKLTYCPYLI